MWVTVVVLSKATLLQVLPQPHLSAHLWAAAVTPVTQADLKVWGKLVKLWLCKDTQV